MVTPLLSSIGRERLDADTVSHYNRDMKNVTITLDEEVARWARIKAAEEETSVSRLVGEMLREKMGKGKAYEASMHRFLARKPVRLRGPKDRYPGREELHER
jgi:hypothetical protein